MRLVRMTPKSRIQPRGGFKFGCWRSRDNWKEKYMKLKTDAKRLQDRGE